jgi:hypothetical protein
MFGIRNPEQIIWYRIRISYPWGGKITGSRIRNTGIRHHGETTKQFTFDFDELRRCQKLVCPHVPGTRTVIAARA